MSFCFVLFCFVRPGSPAQQKLFYKKILHEFSAAVSLLHFPFDVLEQHIVKDLSPASWHARSSALSFENFIQTTLAAAEGKASSAHVIPLDGESERVEAGIAPRLSCAGC